ncbi:MAG TPA: MBL fold metallo-hydrolase [Fimbriimonadaceae bacterium]|nr:MBL fold metallo-hydrolase [Fimbriimonadaceae bacterium]HRJ33945.1 MBL fold metallo-hydrolase [Fimbriimonadaceae bacterium]
MNRQITFMGAAETVTGSKHLIEFDHKKILVDCGLFQGPAELRDRNWEPLAIDPGDIDLILLTHAHIDHIGYLPKIVADGFKGPVYCTHGTAGLAKISLPDSGRLQEEDARYHLKHGTARHARPQPLYTEADAYAALKLLRPVKYFDFLELPGKATCRWIPAGHILGSAFIEFYFPDGEKILMGGDLGRYDTPIIKDPCAVEYAEYLVIESTYGDRRHHDEDVAEHLGEVIRRAVDEAQVIIVPSFAIGRTQELLYYITELQQEGRIPRIPIFVDSPMANAATLLYNQVTEDHDHDMKVMLQEGVNPLRPEHLEFVRDRNQSKALNSRPGPMMIISGSGMANGGRVVHHLKQRLSSDRTVVLFTGYQGVGTLGREIMDGEPIVRIHGQEIEVRATIDKLESLSAHADCDEIIRWCQNFKAPPKQTFIVHGEPDSQAALQEKLRAELGWPSVIPTHMQTIEF